MRNDVAEALRAMDTPEAWERGRLLAIGEIERMEARHDELKRYAMLLQKSVAETLPALERRNADLVEANNRYLDEARTARRAERTVRVMLDIVEARLNKVLEKHDAMVGEVSASWAEAMARETREGARHAG